jgi:hypothetical protein
MLPHEQQSRAYDLFINFDTSLTGTISLGECLQGSDGVYGTFDATDKEKLDECWMEYSDFLAALVTTELDVSSELVSSTFRKFDKGCGKATWTQLYEAVGVTSEDVNTNMFVQALGMSADSPISLSNFQIFVCGWPRHMQPHPLSPRKELSQCHFLELPPVDSTSSTWVPVDSNSSSWTTTTVASASPTGGKTPVTPVAMTPGSTPLRKGGHLRATCRGFDSVPGLGNSPTYPVLLPLAVRRGTDDSVVDVYKKAIKNGSEAARDRKRVVALGSPLSVGPDQCTCTIM